MNSDELRDRTGTSLCPSIGRQRKSGRISTSEEDWASVPLESMEESPDLLLRPQPVQAWTSGLDRDRAVLSQKGFWSHVRKLFTTAAPRASVRFIRLPVDPTCSQYSEKFCFYQPAGLVLSVRVESAALTSSVRINDGCWVFIRAALIN